METDRAGKLRNHQLAMEMQDLAQAEIGRLEMGAMSELGKEVEKTKLDWDRRVLHSQGKHHAVHEQCRMAGQQSTLKLQGLTKKIQKIESEEKTLRDIYHK